MRTAITVKEGEGEEVSTVHQTVKIVEALQALNGGTISELAEVVDLSPGSIYKHLSTLLKNDLVTKEGDTYRVGLRFLEIGDWARRQIPGHDKLQAVIKELAETTEMNVIVTTEENGRPVYLYIETGHDGVSTRANIGGRLYLNQTAGGKAILAYLPEYYVEQIIGYYGLPGATSNTITTRDALFSELEAIRSEGLAYNEGESTKGLYAVAAPVIMPDDSVLGSISIAGPKRQLANEAMKSEVAEELLNAVNKLELELTYS